MRPGIEMTKMGVWEKYISIRPWILGKGRRQVVFGRFETDISYTPTEFMKIYMNKAEMGGGKRKFSMRPYFFPIRS